MSLVNQEDVAAVKARMVSVTVLEMFGVDLEAFDRLLLEKVAQAPKFFRNAPVVLDCAHLQEEVDGHWLDKACEVVRANNLVPVGIIGAAETLEYAAMARSIAVWPVTGKVQEEPQAQEKPGLALTAPSPMEEPAAVQEDSAVVGTADHAEAAETLVIRQPVRSGQKIYARGGDLLVLASVSTGAEIMADGHIHVYGTLRGRALAGVQGKESARVFCTNLQADLVSIAGYYIINDDLPADKRNTAVQMYLEGEELKIESLR